MSSSMVTPAPAGTRGPAGLVVRPVAWGATPALMGRPRLLPITPSTPAPAGTRPAAVPGFDVPTGPAFGAPAVAGYEQLIGTRRIDEHNGTTLGLQPSRRPSS